MNQAVQNGDITQAQAGERLLGLRQQWRAEDTRTAQQKDPEEKDLLLAKAKLALHTDQLGQLNARASRRLELVFKGVVEQDLEAIEQLFGNADPTNPLVGREQWKIHVCA